MAPSKFHHAGRQSSLVLLVLAAVLALMAAGVTAQDGELRFPSTVAATQAPTIAPLDPAAPEGEPLVTAAATSVQPPYVATSLTGFDEGLAASEFGPLFTPVGRTVMAVWMLLSGAVAFSCCFVSTRVLEWINSSL